MGVLSGSQIDCSSRSSLLWEYDDSCCRPPALDNVDSIRYSASSGENTGRCGTFVLPCGGCVGIPPVTPNRISSSRHQSKLPDMIAAPDYRTPPQQCTKEKKQQAVPWSRYGGSKFVTYWACTLVTPDETALARDTSETTGHHGRERLRPGPSEGRTEGSPVESTGTRRAASLTARLW